MAKRAQILKGWLHKASLLFPVMTIPQNPVIVVLGIFLSFILFTQGENYNLETTEYGRLVQECKELRISYDNCFERRSTQIREKYGVPYWVLQLKKEQQKIFLINPCVILIVALFVGFGVSKNEISLTLGALAPVSLVFLKNAESLERILGPVYLLFAAIIAYLVLSFKQNFFVKKPW